MKKQLLLAITTLICAQVTAQTVYNENFDNYTLGNLGTDPNGVVPGQGGWLTEGWTPSSKNNSLFTITSEPNKGKVLTLSGSTTLPQKESYIVKKTNLNTLVDQRMQGNNVLKFELDYYTGPKQNGTNSNNFHSINLSFDPTNLNGGKALVSFTFSPFTGSIGVTYYNGVSGVGDLRLNNISGSTPTLPFNTWIKFNVYLDYTNKKIYFETPYFNKVVGADFLNLSTSSNIMNDFKPSVLSLIFTSTNTSNTVPLFNKFDNIKLTALNTIPAHLDINAVLSGKFSLYPNPATNIVNITSSEQLPVKQVAVYDVTGKLLHTQDFNNEAEIQLNVDALATGTYLVHLKTEQGIAVKKLIKK